MRGREGYGAYRTVEAETSGRGGLVVMLYDGMDRFAARAESAIRCGELEEAHDSLHGIGRILLELLSTLREDRGGEIAVNLRRIYVYCYERTVEANLKKDAEAVREIRGILSNLGEGWRRAVRQGARGGEEELPSPRIRTTA